MKVLKANGKGKFILIKLKQYCQQRGIAIKYITLYLNKQNSFAKKGWKILVIMKNSLLINIGLSSNFWAKAIEIANYL